MSPHSQPTSSPREQLRTLWLDACEASRKRAERAENRGDRGWEDLWRAYWGFVIIEWVVSRMTEPQWRMEDAVMVKLVVEGKKYLQSIRDPSHVRHIRFCSFLSEPDPNPIVRSPSSQANVASCGTACLKFSDGTRTCTLSSM